MRDHPDRASAGYLTGLLVSLNIRWLRQRITAESRLILIGLAAFALGTMLLLGSGYLMSFLVLFLFCGGMFLVHTAMSGLLNHSLDRHHGVINGLYLAFYYLGGAVGSHFPGLIYEAYGWQAVILLCLALLFLCFWLLPWLAREPVLQDRAIS